MTAAPPRRSRSAASGEPVYRFTAPLKEGTIDSRPNRFIMLVKDRGRTLRCHCPATGRLGDLDLRGLRCLYSTSDDGGRKTRFTVEAISTSPEGSGSWVGINQTAANRYLEFFLRNGSLSRMVRGEVKREVKLGRSRIDFLVGDVFVEVKTPLTVLPTAAQTARVEHSRFNSFDRLIRHMGELRRSLAAGKGAIITLCYLYDAAPFRPPRLDGTNARILAAARQAEGAGVQRWQVNLRIDRDGVSLIRYFRSRPYG